MKKIKFLIMDVDGTLTDGKIYMTDEGELCKTFNVKDGIGICNIAIPGGIIPIIITGRNSSIVLRRCEELGITHVYQGVKDKIKTLKSVIDDISVAAYIGDDINDLECMEYVKAAGGIVGCPDDAVEKVIGIADYVAEHKGGDGAVRDFVEWLVKNKMI